MALFIQTRKKNIEVKKIRQLLSKINIGDQRSVLLVKNVLASFVVKGWASLVVLLMIPITLKCLGNYQNGVWLTISSMLVWIDQFDVGLGNGLRNKLTTYMAQGKVDDARRMVTSTFLMLILIMSVVLPVLLLIVSNINLYAILNVSPEMIPELRVAVISAVILVCLTFILKFIGNVYMGMQMPAVSNGLIALGQTLALIFTLLLLAQDKATFMMVVAVNTGCPFLVYLVAYPYTFRIKYPFLRPNVHFIDWKAMRELGNVGVCFFWLQIAAILQFMSSNILISNLYTPELVTPYQVAYRYTSIAMLVFNIICMPIWNATADAYARNDFDWIHRANRKMGMVVALLTLLLVVMVVVSPWVYDIWIGGQCHVPITMTGLMAIYLWMLIQSMRYSYFLNGMGVLRLQMYMTISAVAFIPLAWLMRQYFTNIEWFIVVMCVCNLPGLITNTIQFNKIINGKATGIWKA